MLRCTTSRRAVYVTLGCTVWMYAKLFHEKLCHLMLCCITWSNTVPFHLGLTHLTPRWTVSLDSVPFHAQLFHLTLYQLLLCSAILWGEHWDFRFCGFRYFFDRFFDFCVKRLRFFGFGTQCGFWFFLFFSYLCIQFCMRFSVLADFVCGFAVLDEFFFGFAVSSIPQCPSHLWQGVLSTLSLFIISVS